MPQPKTPHFHTTIKVTSDVRDRLKVQAALNHLTLGDYISKLAEIGERQLRFEAMQAAISATPPELMNSYREETEFWDSANVG